MLIKVLEYSRFVRWMLPLLMVFPFVTREIHVLLDEHDEHEVCLHQGEEQHFHQGQEHADDCIICDFTFSSFEVPEDIQPSNTHGSFDQLSPKSYTCRNHSYSLLTYSLRGPPADRLS